MGDGAHWDAAYDASGVEGVSWYEREPTSSLELIESLLVDRLAPVVDIGGGASTLATELVARGYTDVTVLDVSRVALEEGRRQRRNDESVAVVCADVRTRQPDRRFSLWHDRACLHFLTTAVDRRSYLRTLDRSLAPGGAVVIATFGADGPTSCSGLDVVRYDPEALLRLLGDGFEPVETRLVRHVTPSGTEQPFTFVAVRRR